MQTININNLYKKVSDTFNLKVDQLDLEVGKIYGLVGPNGAGKTTLIRHLVGAYQGDTGFVELEGMRIYENPEAKAKLVYIPDEFFDTFGHNIRDIKELYQGIYPSFNEARYLRLMKMFKHDSLENFSKFSKGMKKQVMFILALAIMPEYLIMDEPFDGLDPHIRKVIWDILIQDVSERNMTILISSHVLEELSKLATHYGIIHNGSLLQEISREELMKRCSERIELELDYPEQALPILDKLGFTNYQVMDKHRIYIFERLEESALLNMELAKVGIFVKGISITSEDLESYFLNLTGGAQHA